jgi:hypothetical protein
MNKHKQTKQIPHNRVSLNLSRNDYNILKSQADKSGLKMSEWLRLIIQIFGVSEKASQWEPSNGPLKFDIGGYGYEIPQHYLMEAVKLFESNLEALNRLNEEVMIGYVEKTQKHRVKRFKEENTL